MTVVNIHSGTSDKGNSGSRGSAGCITIWPSDASGFFSNFNFSGGNTGKAHGTVTVRRVSQTERTKSFQQQKAKSYRNQLKGIF
jgi:hypothetical protein